MESTFFLCLWLWCRERTIAAHTHLLCTSGGGWFRDILSICFYFFIFFQSALLFQGQRLAMFSNNSKHTVYWLQISFIAVTDTNSWCESTLLRWLLSEMTQEPHTLALLCFKKKKKEKKKVCFYVGVEENRWKEMETVHILVEVPNYCRGWHCNHTDRKAQRQKILVSAVAVDNGLTFMGHRQ